MPTSLPAHDSAFVEFQALVASVSSLSQRKQNRRLKVELRRAIERAHAHENRARALKDPVQVADATTLRTLEARCAELDTVCRLLLETIEQAALAEAAPAAASVGTCAEASSG
jgi:hypothetical protein